MEQFFQQFIVSNDLTKLKSKDEDPYILAPTPNNALTFNSQSYQIPHPQKLEKGGEDAYFISNDGKGLGVADGVGGWVSYGVDPALYSRQLMREAKKAYDEYHLRQPEAVLEFAYNHMKDIQGSTTACVVVLQGNTLHISNLGDSGVLIIRDNKILFRTKEQQHIFNFPVQLGTGHSTTPKDSDSITIPAEPGDIIILATDGLFDNLFDHEILSIANQHNHPNTHSEYGANTGVVAEAANHSGNLAQVLCEKAFAHAESTTIETPFTRHAYELGYLESPFGGKLDDITVIAATVIPQPTTTTTSL